MSGLKISIFTPTNRAPSKFFDEAWAGILEQTYPNWEWLIVENNGGKVPEHISSHPNVRVVTFDKETPEGEPNSIGALKRFGALHCSGDVLVELDDDDILTPDACQVLAETYTDNNVQTAYSNCVEFRSDTWESRVFGARWGWQSRPYNYKGREMQQCVAWPPGPWNLRYICWSPNHLRSWRKSAYIHLGGHDPLLELVDDHDLNIRAYLAFGAKGVRHIDEALYMYRLHGDSNCQKYLKKIQASDKDCYRKYVVALAERWSFDNHLLTIDLGGAFNPKPGYMTVDKKNAQIETDLNERWPFADNSVGIIRAMHVVEHLKDPVHVMNEMYRVLAPGGWAFIEVPSTDGRGAFQDPTHVSYWNENSFWYYTREDKAKFVPEIKARFQVSRLSTYKWTKDEIPVTQAHLIALKPGYEERRAGEILI